MAVDQDQREKTGVTPEGAATDDAFANIAQAENDARFNDIAQNYNDDRFNDIASHPDNQDLNSLGKDTDPRRNIQAKEESVANANKNPMNYSEQKALEANSAKTDSGKRKGLSGLQRGGIVGAILGGGSIIAFMTGPALGIGQIHSLFDKLTGHSSAVHVARSNGWFRSKLSGGPGAAVNCALQKYLCRVTTMSTEEVKALKDNGYDLVDGKDVAGGRKAATGVVDLETGKVTDAKNITKEALTNKKLNGALNAVYPGVIAHMRDTVAARIFGEKGVSRSPKVTEGAEDTTTEEGRNKNAAKNTAELERQSNVTNAITGDDDLKSMVDEQIKAETAAIEAGTPTSGFVEPLSIELAPEPKLSLTQSLKSGAIGLLQDPVTATATIACSGANRAQMIVNIAKFAGVAAAMAYFGTVIAVWEKTMSGDTSVNQTNLANDISHFMDTFNKPDAEGNTFGDSAGYHAYTDGLPTSTAIQSGITGGAFLGAVTAFVMFLKSYAQVNIPVLNRSVGLATGNISACKILMDPATQIEAAAAGTIAQIIIAIFTGGAGNLAEFGAKEALQTGITATIKTILKDSGINLLKNLAGKTLIEGIAEAMAKGILEKGVIKKIGFGLVEASVRLGGPMLIGYLITKFAVPYLAKLAMGTIISPDSNGVAAIDTVLMGGGALVASVGMARGLSTLSHKQYAVFDDYTKQYEKEYAASQHLFANQFDLSNPYSTLGSVGVKMAPYISKLNIIANPSQIANLPMTILGMLSPAMATDTSYAATAAERENFLSLCKDVDMTTDRDVAYDPYCNPVMGFSDMNMLENTTTPDVFNYMKSKGQVDDDGNQVTGATALPVGTYGTMNYADFRKKCVDGTEIKSISQAVEETSQIDPMCVAEDFNDLEVVKYFRLMSIDKSIDGGPEPATALTATTTTPPSGGCPANTKSYGTQQGYVGGVESDITTCGILDWPTNFPNSAGEMIVEVNSAIAQKTADMAAALKATGYSRTASIGFRTNDQQTCIYNYFTSGVQGCSIFKTRPEKADPPGFSNHQMGYSIDMDTGYKCDSPSLKSYIQANQWLDSNMAKYGFSRNAGCGDYGHMTNKP